MRISQYIPSFSIITFYRSKFSPATGVRVGGGIWAIFLNSKGGSSTPEMDVPSPTAGSKVLDLSKKHHMSKRCMFTEFLASTLASTTTTFTSKRCCVDASVDAWNSVNMHLFDVWCFFETSRTFDPAVGLGTSISGVDHPLN